MTWIAITVVLFLAALAVHEAGHALVLAKFGVPIEAAGLGMPAQPMLTINPAGRRQFTITFSVWLLGAYVKPHRDHRHKLNTLTYRDTTWYAGVGIVANLVFAGALATAVSALDAADWWHPLAWAAVTAAVWLARRPLCAYVFPIISIPLAGVFAVATVQALFSAKPIGVIGLAQTFSEANNLTSALTIGAAVSFALALVNVLPVYPADGGRIVDAAIHTLWGCRPASIFRTATTAVTLGMIVCSVGSDITTLLPS